MITVGISVSNLADTRNPGHEVPERLARLVDLLARAGLGVELQLEMPGRLAAVHVPHLQAPFVGVHQPIGGVDFARAELEDVSMRCTREAARLAAEAGADYLTIHLQGLDYWDRLAERRDLIAHSLRMFDRLRSEVAGLLLIENLEYPKYPSTLDEMAELKRRYEGDDSVGLLLDVAHLWHSGHLIAGNMEKYGGLLPAGDPWASAVRDAHDPGRAFLDYLGRSIQSLGESLRGFHFTGGHGHETHLLPGSRPGEPTLPIRRGYEGNEIDVPGALRVIATHMRRDAFLVNEAMGYTYGTIVDNAREVQEILEGDNE